MSAFNLLKEVLFITEGSVSLITRDFLLYTLDSPQPQSPTPVAETVVKKEPESPREFSTTPQEGDRREDSSTPQERLEPEGSEAVPERSETPWREGEGEGGEKEKREPVMERRELFPPSSPEVPPAVVRAAALPLGSRYSVSRFRVEAVPHNPILLVIKHTLAVTASAHFQLLVQPVGQLILRLPSGLFSAPSLVRSRVIALARLPVRIPRTSAMNLTVIGRTSLSLGPV